MYIYNGVLVTTEFQICLKRNIYDSYDTNLRASFFLNVPSSMYHKHADNSMSTPNAGMTHTCKMYTLALVLGWLTHPISSLHCLPSHALQIRMVCTEYLQYKAALHPVNMRHQVRETNTSRSDQPHWVYQTPNSIGLSSFFSNT